MKFVLNSLRVGENLRGRVEEVLSETDLLLSIGGDLLRVQNETAHRYRRGDAILLQVKAIRPLRFQVRPDPRDLRRNGRLDTSV